MGRWTKWTYDTGWCSRCGQYKAKWVCNNTGSVYCKYCHVEERGVSAPVPAYMKEMIPLE